MRIPVMISMVVLGILPRGLGAEAPQPVILDGFENAAQVWSAHPADGVDLRVGSDVGFQGNSIRLDFNFRSGAGYAVARRELPLDLPENYVLSFRIRGEAPVNHLEFKLLDESGENVWWSVRRDVEFPREWEVFRYKKRHFSFAWGPRGGGEIKHVAAIEFAVTAGSGGQGSVWIDDLELLPLPSSRESFPEPVSSASSEGEGGGASAVVDGDAESFWSPDPADSDPRLTLDLGGVREFGGLVVDWSEGFSSADYGVETSNDATTWEEVRRVEGGNGGRDYLYLPESEARFVRLRIPRTEASPRVAALSLRPLEWSRSREAFFAEIAADARRGIYPRGVGGEQAYWTVVGADGDPVEGLLGEDGALETGKAGFSVEPFLFTGGRLATWADARIDQRLEGGYLPIPTSRWRMEHLELEVTAAGVGDPGTSALLARYRVRNLGPVPASPELFLAVRAFQVNPPSQTLNTRGGTAPVSAIDREGRFVLVNGKRVLPLVPPDRFGATSFDGGDVVADYLPHNEVPVPSEVRDPFGAASAAMGFSLELAPGGSRDIFLWIPLHEGIPPPPEGADAPVWAEAALKRSREGWQERLSTVKFRLPPEATLLVDTIKSQVAYILVNRAGPAIQPGVRSYARSWIRDGALTSSALLRFGLFEPVREFIEWYAPNQFENGKVPCVVDFRGADPVPEHDSSGEFIYLLAEYYRFTGDRELLERMWPRVLSAAEYLDRLRQERMTDEFRERGMEPFFGILPPSISHEGYSAKPMHSYWDDLFALKGFADAAFLAEELGKGDEAARLQEVHAEFARNFARSVAAAMLAHDIDYVPGCADLGDFDPTATTIALDPVGAVDVLPPGSLRRTFEAYYRFFTQRSQNPWEAYTPYEIRNVGAFVRLGWRERAGELLDFFFSHQRPTGWNQWAEVVWREERLPHFLGDLPHTWVGSDFVRSALDLFVYHDQEADALVVGAGIPERWLDSPEGVAVEGLRTRFGRLDMELRRGEAGVEVKLGGNLRVPPGGLVIRAPVPEAPRSILVNGRPLSLSKDGSITVREVPALVVLSF